MIESVRIRNFRCFEDVAADDLGNINVIVGDNGVGKTALLETLFLLATNTPEAHMRFLRWREGSPINLMKMESVRFSWGEFWADLFHWFELDRKDRD